MTNERAHHYFFSAIETGEQIDVKTNEGHALYLAAENALEENTKLKAENERLAEYVNSASKTYTLQCEEIKQLKAELEHYRSEVIKKQLL